MHGNQYGEFVCGYTSICPVSAFYSIIGSSLFGELDNQCNFCISVAPKETITQCNLMLCKQEAAIFYSRTFYKMKPTKCNDSS